VGAMLDLASIFCSGRPQDLPVGGPTVSLKVQLSHPLLNGFGQTDLEKFIAARSGQIDVRSNRVSLHEREFARVTLSTMAVRRTKPMAPLRALATDDQ